MPSKLFRLLLSALIGLSIGQQGFAQSTITIGTGTSSSSTRGPFQRADTNSSTVYSRWIQVFTASELATAGLPNGASISQLNWEIASSNVIIGSGNANLKIYVKNSSATKASTGSWTTLTAGSTLALDTNYNTTNNFPGANGWMPFAFSSPFTYTGGALEVAVDWDCSQVSTPAFSGNGAIKFRWASTSPDTLVVKKTSSSSPSSTISDSKTERANIQIVYSLTTCDPPTAIMAQGTTNGAYLNWGASATASSYNWKIVPAGAGSMATAIASGSTSNTLDTATGLSALTSYDLYVESDCGANGLSSMVGPFTFLTPPAMLNTLTIGTGSSSSSTRGPFQRSDTNSSTVYSRFVQIYSASELSAAGLTSGSIITAANWELASSNTIIGAGDAQVKIYIKNSSATAATAGSWSTLIAGSANVVDRAYNTVNNFPGANGWMPFNFNSAFIYTGGALEIAFDWDCSQVSTPAFSGDGALKWRWTSTSPDTMVVKKTSSSSASSTISDLKTDRANIQLVYTTAACNPPTALNVVPSTTGGHFNWASSSSASSYVWRVVAQGAGAMATAIDSGSSTTNADSSTALTPLMIYDLYVASDCGGTLSTYAGPFTFMPQPTMLSTGIIGTGTSSSSTRGPFQRSDTNSSTVYSRFVQVYTASELSGAGINSGSVLTQLFWELASSNMVIGSGDATLKVYVKNSSASSAQADSWTNFTSGATMVVDRAFNTTNNFPGANGWMPYYFDEPFTYTGGSLEVMVDWDCSMVSTPAFSGDGSLKWRWSSTAPDTLVVKKTSSSSPSSNISDQKDERANIQFAFVAGAPSPCDPPSNLLVSNIGSTDADLSWSGSSSATGYAWKIVAAGAGSAAAPVDSATTTDSTATTTSLTSNTAYDLYVWADCASSGMSTAAGPFNFMTVDDASLEDLGNFKSFSMHPNPADKELNLNISLHTAAQVQVKLLSVSGEVLQEQASENVSEWNTRIDLSTYAQGLYLVLVSVDGKSAVYQLAVAH